MLVIAAILFILLVLSVGLVVKWKREHDAQKKLFDECFAKYEALDEEMGKLSSDYSQALGALTKMYQAVLPITFKEGKELPLGNQTQKERDDLLAAIITARKAVMDS